MIFQKYNYVLEIHFNSGGGSGSEIFVTTAESGITVEDEILKNLCNCVKYHNRGVKQKRFPCYFKNKISGSLFSIARGMFHR